MVKNNFQNEVIKELLELTKSNKMENNFQERENERNEISSSIATLIVITDGEFEGVSYNK